MDKTLQTTAWSCLPKEFKEEVKKMYVTPYKYFESNYSGACAAFNMLFGIHNLTSDAEGEEMLTCEKSKVQYRIQYAKEGVEENPDYYNGYAQAIYDLFGSKCLPDEKVSNPTPLAEPKEKNHIEENLEMVKDFDNIIKDGFYNERRLNIAAQIVASMIGSDDWTTWRGSSDKEIWHNMAKSSLEIADALIAEAQKGESK